MKKVSDFKMGTKVILFVGLLILVAMAAIIFLVGLNITSMSESNAGTLSKEIAYHYSSLLKVDIDEAFIETRSLTAIIESMVNIESIEVSREEVIDMLLYYIEDNTQFLGVYVVFEPNAFDGKDELYINKPGYDETGRLIPYLTRGDDGKGVIEALVGYDVEGDGDYYQIPKRTNQEAILDPYLYSVQGKDVLLTSLVVPIHNNSGQFIGIAGVDLSLNSIQEAISNITIEGFPKAYLTFYSASGNIVAGENEELLGASVNDSTHSAELIQNVKANENFDLVYYSEVVNEVVITTGIAQEVGKTGSKWLVEVNLSQETLMAEARHVVYLLMIIGIIVVILFTIAIILLTNSITKPLKSALQATMGVSEGNLTVEFESKNQDEVGQLSTALNNMTTNLHRIISGILDSTSQVTQGVNQISETTQQISTGASEQAASTEEISSSMEELVANIQQNTENAQRAENISRESSSEAEIGGESVEKTVLAMRSISEKISVIEDIARNTNMLALNAAIEAARAGDAGKGFAVVASEVRKLAENSGKAAAEITSISLSSVEAAEKAGEVITALVPKIRETADLVQEITTASKEQSTGAEQINSAIQQLDSVIQQNASSAEELASMAEELTGQATMMESNVSFFQLGNGSSQKKAPVQKRESEAPQRIALASPSTNQGVTSDDEDFESF